MRRRIIRILLSAWCCIGFCVGISQAQNSSLYQRPLVAPSSSVPMTSGGNNMVASGATPANAANALQTASWTYKPGETPRVLKIHDIVFIRVDELAQSTAQGNTSSRKNALYDARLQDWVSLEGLNLKPAAQNDGDPRIQGQENEVYRADSTMRTRESLTFNIAAEVADIRPNGTIVLSAQKTLTNNDNVFEFSLSGICRAADITPDNTVMSRQIYDLKVGKVDRGHVRDGYSRGWLTKFIARIKPF